MAIYFVKEKMPLVYSILRKSLILMGFYKFLKRHVALRKFKRDLHAFKTLHIHDDRSFALSLNANDLYPCLGDDTSDMNFDRHYVYHTSWAARIIEKTKPTRHVDISSSLFFCGIVSAYCPIETYDFRSPTLELPNLKTGAADLTSLRFSDRSLPSLSCMHVVEHLGLGRYGDPLNAQADIQGMRELQRVLSSNGQLLFVVPVGIPKILFNAHRIYSYEFILATFDELTLEEFALVPDEPQGGHDFLLAADPSLVKMQNYGCGCFLFRRKP